jgi:hypothetical protein
MKIAFYLEDSGMRALSEGSNNSAAYGFLPEGSLQITESSSDTTQVIAQGAPIFFYLIWMRKVLRTIQVGEDDTLFFMTDYSVQIVRPTPSMLRLIAPGEKLHSFDFEAFKNAIDEVAKAIYKHLEATIPDRFFEDHDYLRALVE